MMQEYEIASNVCRSVQTDQFVFSHAEVQTSLSMIELNKKNSDIYRSTSPVRGETGPAEFCFICNRQSSGGGVLLFKGHTLYSNTDLPTKIGQVVGDEFLVVVTTEDVLCRRCEVLLNHMDKLEVETFLVKKELLTFLRTKYQLTDDGQATQISEDSSRDVHSAEKEGSVTKSGQEQADYIILEEVNSLKDKRKCKSKVSMKDLEDVSESGKHSKQNLHNHICASCGFKALCPNKLKSHVENCDFYLCVMCNKQFRNKGIQRHIMQQHLSTWICHFCNATFPEEHEYTSHLEIHLTKPGHSRLHQAKQNFADYESKDKGTTLATDTMQTDKKCRLCNYQTTKKCLEDHTCELKSIKCTKCERQIRNKTYLARHLKSCPQGISYRSLNSNKRLANENDIFDHSKNHMTSETNCKAKVVSPVHDLGSADTKFHLIDHEYYTSDNGMNVNAKHLVQSSCEPYICSICFENFVSESLYAEHLKSHKCVQPVEEFVEDTEYCVTKKNTTHSDDLKSKHEHKIKPNVHKKQRKSHLNSVVEFTRNRKDPDLTKNLETNFKCICGTDFNDSNQFEDHKTREKCYENISEENQVQRRLLSTNDSAQVHQENKSSLTLANLSVENTYNKVDGLEDSDTVSCVEDEPSTENSNEVHYVLDMGMRPFYTDVNSNDRHNTASEDKLNNWSKACQDRKTGDNVINTKLAGEKTPNYQCDVCSYCSPDLISFKIHLDGHKSSEHTLLYARESLPMRKVPPRIKSEKLQGKLLKLYRYKRRTAAKEKVKKFNPHERPLEQYFCRMCDKSYSSWTALRKHKSTHSNKPLHECDSCILKFSEESELIHHKYTVHRDNK